MYMSIQTGMFLKLSGKGFEMQSSYVQRSLVGDTYNLTEKKGTKKRCTGWDEESWFSDK